MAVVFPDGIVQFIEAGQLAPLSQAIFPDGKRYYVTSVATTSEVGLIRIEGHQLDFSGTKPKKKSRCTFKMGVRDVLPVVMVNPLS